MKINRRSFIKSQAIAATAPRLRCSYGFCRAPEIVFPGYAQTCPSVEHIQPLLQRDFISQLAKEGLPDLAKCILGYLDSKSLRNAEMVKQEPFSSILKLWLRFAVDGMTLCTMVCSGKRTSRTR